MSAQRKLRLVFCAGCGLDSEGHCTCASVPQRQAEPELGAMSLLTAPSELWLSAIQGWLSGMQTKVGK